MSLRLGPWLLQDRLGGGGMGDVWRAEHVTARVPAAVKRLGDRDPRLLAALRTELRAAASLDHPGVVEVLDQGADPEPWIAMELAEGGSLAELPPIGWPALRRALLDVLDALAHAHARGVLHRDLKPANLLRGGDGRTRLADFGIAHALREPGSAAEEPVGTLAFAAPEQITGRLRDQGPPTDLYALGCTAWVLATGRPPFPDDPLGGHLGRALPALEPRHPVPEGLEGWLRRLLEKDPTDRYPSAAAASLAFLRLPGVSGGDASAVAGPELPPAGVTLTLGPSAWQRQPATALAFSSRRVPSPVESVPLPSDWREGARPPRLLPSVLSLVGLRRPRLVGREEERDRLWATLRTSAAGVRAVVLEGAAGTGKTRLAEWLAERVEECGGVALRTSAGAGVGAWIAAAARCEGLGPAEARERLVAHRPSLPAEDLEALLALVAGPPPREPPIGAVCRWLAGFAPRPLALVWDDLPEAPDGRRWWTALSGSDLPALLIATARGSAGPLEGGERMTLGPLPPGHRRALVRDLVDTSDALTAEIDERTGGNPLFAVQLVRAWASRGLLVQGPSGLVLGEGVEPALPPDLSEVWRERVDQVARDDRTERTLVLAALLGHDPRLGELRGACERAGLPPPDPVLEEALTAGLFRGRPGHLSWDHGLLREHLVTRREADRPALHAAIAAALPEGPAHDARIGRHHLGAGHPELAVGPLAAAAAAAGRGVDQGLAASLCDAWQAALDQLGAHDDDIRRAPLLRRRTGIAIDTGRLDLATDLATRHIALADGAGWPSALRIEPRLLRASVADRRTRITEALADLADAEALVGPDTPPDVVARLHVTRSSALANAGRPTQAEAEARAGLAVVIEPYLRSEILRALAAALMRAGQLDEAADAFVRAAEAYTAAGATRSAAAAIGEAAAVDHARGDLEKAERGYRRSIALLADGSEVVALNAMTNLAIVRVLLHDPDDAARWLDRAIPRLRSADYRASLLYAVAARWATLPPGPAWDEAADEVALLQAQSGIEDPDLAALAEIAASRAEGARADRAKTFAAARRHPLPPA